MGFRKSVNKELEHIHERIDGLYRIRRWDLALTCRRIGTLEAKANAPVLKTYTVTSGHPARTEKIEATEHRPNAGRSDSVAFFNGDEVVAVFNEVLSIITTPTSST